MATYCVSDLHGHFDELMTMLEVIEFDPEKDRLFILGDVIDRGPQSAELLWWLMKEAPQSVHCLLGNHEDMLWAAVDAIVLWSTDNITLRRDDSWSYNGGFETLRQIRSFNKYYPEWETEIVEWIENLPLCYDLDINGKRFILIHAALQEQIQYPDDMCVEGIQETIEIEEWPVPQRSQAMLWNRISWLYDKYTEWPFDIVCGHTPVNTIYNFMFDDLEIPWQQREERKSILHFGKGLRKHLIDCGVARGGYLACLRLDDMHEFYV